MPEKIDGLTILVGTAACNARCRECAGRQHRPNAPTRDGELDEARLKEVLEHCYARQCRSISLNGSGEPTLSPKSVTKTLAIIRESRPAGLSPVPVSLYTNGLRLDSDKKFCAECLPSWRSLGLTAVYVSAFSEDEELNRQGLGVKSGPDFRIISGRIRDYGLRWRVNVILKQGFTDTAEKFEALCRKFFGLGAFNVSAWPLKNEAGDSVSALAPTPMELARMRAYVDRSPELNIRLLLDDGGPAKNVGQKFALFQDGKFSSGWCSR